MFRSAVGHGRVFRLVVAGVLLSQAGFVRGADWPQWGGDASRNMASPETGLPVQFGPGSVQLGTARIDPSTTEGVRWVAKLGNRCHGNPTVSAGRVYVGTNNESPADPKYVGDRSVLLCLSESTGELEWQFNVPKLRSGKVTDFDYLGICSSPTVVGDRVYIVTNRCEVVALDVNGMADGNDGPFVDEGAYLNWPYGEPMALSESDADIVWVYDMRSELGVVPHNATASSILVVGDRAYVTTSNGVDWSHSNMSAPSAPALICLDRHTGSLLARERSGISERTFHGNWSSPAHGVVGGQEQVIFGAGDGFLYGFDPEPRDGTLAELWRFDCNPPEYRAVGGRPGGYGRRKGPSEVLGTPVIDGVHIYATIGQDPINGPGSGHLVCLSTENVGSDGVPRVTWSTKSLQRSLSTVAVSAGLVFAADVAGTLHCFDAVTGKRHWTEHLQGAVWGSPMVAGDVVYICTEDGDLSAYAAAPVRKLLGRTIFDEPVYSTPVIANGALYVATPTQLYSAGRGAPSPVGDAR